MVAILPILGGIATAASLAPLAGPAIDVATGDYGKKIKNKYLTTGPDADGDFGVSFIDRQFIDEDALQGQFDTRRQKQIADELARRVELTGLMPELGESKGKYLARSQGVFEEKQTEKSDKNFKRQQDLIYNTPQAIEARNIAEESRNFTRYLQEETLADKRQGRLDRISREKTARDDRLQARQDNLDLGLAELAFKKGQSEQNYNLALQQMERNSKLAHQQKMASIIGGIGALAAGFAV